ncbi:MAG TPA: outer membrane beta-barrel protein [Arenibacter sp.]|nr:outer membrane beta-barrel protein [Arenibacter sp.]
MKTITDTKYAKKIVPIIILLSSFPLLSQGNNTEIKKLTLSGSIDAYYRVNLNGDNRFNKTTDRPNAAPGSSFSNLPGFALGMANITASYKGEKVGFVADLVFGPRGTDAIFNSPLYSATGNTVNQLYAYWQVHRSVKLTFGNFNTFMGYEVISPVGNFNYSTSYLFSYGPFSHTGIKIDIVLTDRLSLILAAMNPTDQTELNPSGKYAYGAQLGYNGQFLNILMDDGAFEIDLTGSFDVSDKFYLGINAAYYDYDDLGFAGMALYPRFRTSEHFTVGLRGEYFVETGNFGAIGTGKEDSDLFAITLTGSATIGNLIIKPELRLDSSSDPSLNFLDKDLLPQKSLSSFVLAVIYGF